MKTLNLIRDCQNRMWALQEMIPVKSHQLRITEIDEITSDANIWNDNRRAAALLKERQQLVALLDRINNINEQLGLLVEYAETFPEESDNLVAETNELNKLVSEFELSQMLKNPNDSAPAILTITAGAGGLEAANWVNMLLRSYLRFADANGYKAEILDLKPSEEHSAICIDSVSIRIEGEYAYGYLKNETGVHRLIRNSPFNAGDARHTSFAAVSVAPDIEDNIDIEINENDLEIQATRSGGAGGQAVNKISSCIILKHLPTGIMIRSQTERSQHDNRKIALKLLKLKLYDLELKKKNLEKEKQLEQQSTSAFGSQIRTTTLMPYTLVKDHRTGFETNQAQKFLDGDIMDFLVSSLRHNSIKQ